MPDATNDLAELFRHVGQGNAAALQEMLRYRPELARARAPSSLSILSFARYMGQDAILEQLIAAGPPLDIFDAACVDRAERVKELLAGDPGLVAAYSEDGFTALHFAAYFGATGAIVALLAAGADTERRTQNFLSNMPLHAAAAGGRVEAARMLLNAGADPNAKQHGKNTALMTAAFSNNRELAEMLIARNADVELRNEEGKTAADIAAGIGNMELSARLRLAERVVDRRVT
jgi:ankyrin repeat protein